MELTNRFWNKIATHAPNDCWEWISWTAGSCGYGYYKLNGLSLKATRLLWEYFNGPIPNGFCVLHTCDNPACVNPDHLWLGTQKDNVHDCIRKGRHVAIYLQCTPEIEAKRIKAVQEANRRRCQN